MKTIIIELDSPIPYANGTGVEVEGSFIEVNEPTGKQAHLVAILRAEMGAATRAALKDMKLPESGGSDATEADAKDDDPTERGEGCFTMLTMGGADMQKVMVTIKEILKVTSMLAGEVDFKSGHYDRMSYSDCEKTLKAYLGNFIPA